jgi:hypothetical protein
MSENKPVFISELSEHTVKIIFDAGWASMNVASQRPIGLHHSRPAFWGRFYLHCGIEETGSPGNICNVCHQVLCHPSEAGTSSMRKHLLEKAQGTILMN